VARCRACHLDGGHHRYRPGRLLRRES
jgi:hypothetical protein